jgi:hypothetical protein
MRAHITVENDKDHPMRQMATRTIAQDCKCGAPILCLPGHGVKPEKAFINLASMETIDPFDRRVRPYPKNTRVNLALGTVT